MLDKAKFAPSFAADVPKDKAEFMADSLVPWGVQPVDGTVSKRALTGKSRCRTVNSLNRPGLQ